MEEIILASGSPRRQELLTRIGVAHRVIKSEVEEHTTQTEPGRIVEELSRRKAEDVALRIKEGIVLGADTIVWLDGRALGKPEDRADAKRMLQSLQGRTHEVYTGVTLIRAVAPAEQSQDTLLSENLQTESFHSMTRVHIHSMTEQEIEAYLDTGDSFDKAGSYGVQGRFAAFVDGIEGDYHTVMGLPVSMVYQALKRFVR